MIFERPKSKNDKRAEMMGELDKRIKFIASKIPKEGFFAEIFFIHERLLTCKTCAQMNKRAIAIEKAIKAGLFQKK